MKGLDPESGLELSWPGVICTGCDEVGSWVDIMLPFLEKSLRAARSFSNMDSSHWHLVCSVWDSTSRWFILSCISRTIRWCSSFCSSSCSSSSPTRAALRSLKALCAARFCAFRFVGGVSVAGLRPGFGRGGMTHSLEVMETGPWADGESMVAMVAEPLVEGRLFAVVGRIAI